MLDFILFDVDNTLYPKSVGLFDRVAERIRGYMEVRLGYEKELSRELRLDYIKKYGSTLRGLMIHQKVDAADFLEYVHDVDVEERVAPNPALAQILEAISIDRAIFTSGHHPYARRVLRSLGVEQYFPRIFDIIFTQYIPKPNPEPYRQILDVVGIDPSRIMIIDDVPANLKTAKDLGMTTVLVDPALSGPQEKLDGFMDFGIRDILEIAEVLKKTGVAIELKKPAV